MRQGRRTGRVGVVLSGCGAWDGSEIHETVLTLLALDRAGVSVVCAAADRVQLHVLNHLSHEEMEETRHIIIESARLARGAVVGLQALRAGDLDAVILPGGHGAIKHLSDFALKGPQAVVDAELQRLMEEMLGAQKPIGAISAAVITVVRALHSVRPSVTIGDDMGTAAAIVSMGGRHHPCTADQIHADPPNRIVTTPGYMAGTRITQVAAGIDKMVRAVLAMADRL